MSCLGVEDALPPCFQLSSLPYVSGLTHPVSVREGRRSSAPLNDTIPEQSCGFVCINSAQLEFSLPEPENESDVFHWALVHGGEGGAGLVRGANELAALCAWYVCLWKSCLHPQ